MNTQRTAIMYTRLAEGEDLYLLYQRYAAGLLLGSQLGYVVGAIHHDAADFSPESCDELYAAIDQATTTSADAIIVVLPPGNEGEQVLDYFEQVWESDCSTPLLLVIEDRGTQADISNRCVVEVIRKGLPVKPGVSVMNLTESQIGSQQEGIQ